MFSSLSVDVRFDNTFKAMQGAQAAWRFHRDRTTPKKHRASTCPPDVVPAKDRQLCNARVLGCMHGRLCLPLLGHVARRWRGWRFCEVFSSVRSLSVDEYILIALKAFCIYPLRDIPDTDQTKGRKGC